MKKKWLVLFILICSHVFGQNPKKDSLSLLVKKDKDDTNKIIHLNKLSEIYWRSGSYDSAATYANNALAIAVVVGNRKEQKEKQTQLLAKKGIAEANNNLGCINIQQGNYPKALEYWLKALKIDEELNNKKGISSRLGYIGIVYKEQGDYTKALDYYFRALKMKEELGDKSEIAKTLGNIGTVYHQQANYTKALEMYFKALKIAEEVGDKQKAAIQLGNIGVAYTAQKNYSKALEVNFKSLEMKKEIGDKSTIAIQLGNIGVLYGEQGKPAESEKYLLEALKMEREIGAQNDERKFEELLSSFYEKSGRDKLALQHYKKAVLLKDSLFSQENRKQLIKKELNFEFEKKEAVANAEHKSELDKQSAIAEEKSKKQTIVIWSVLGGFLLVVVFAGFVLRSLRVTRKQKHIIELQKDEVSKQKHKVDEAYDLLHEKNKEVMDSINYASRIQRALITPEKYIENSLMRLMKNS